MLQRPLNIYLAGKVSAHDWRHTLVADLRTALNAYRQDLVCGDVSIPSAWPLLHQAIFDTHHYVGPFFVACDHRCFHGRNSHGSRSGIQFVEDPSATVPSSFTTGPVRASFSSALLLFRKRIWFLPGLRLWMLTARSRNWGMPGR